MEDVNEAPDDEGRLKLRFGLFEEMPENVFSFAETLTSLNLSNNRLTTISSKISSLLLLRELNVSHNFIDKIGDSIGGCIRLRSLDISHNRLSCIPNGLFKCTLLETLSLSFNQISELPQFVCKLFVLAKLDVKNNLLNAIPCELSEIVSVRRPRCLHLRAKSHFPRGRNSISPLFAKMLIPFDCPNNIIPQRVLYTLIQIISKPTLKNISCSENSNQIKMMIPDGMMENSSLILWCLKLRTAHHRAQTQGINQYELQEDLTIAKDNIRLRLKEEISTLKNSLLVLESDIEEAQMFYQKWYDFRDECKTQAEKVWETLSALIAGWRDRGQINDS